MVSLPRKAMFYMAGYFTMNTILFTFTETAKLKAGGVGGQVTHGLGAFLWHLSRECLYYGGISSVVSGITYVLRSKLKQSVEHHLARQVCMSAAQLDQACHDTTHVLEDIDDTLSTCAYFMSDFLEVPIERLNELLISVYVAGKLVKETGSFRRVGVGLGIGIVVTYID
eukprot:PhF_6_TR37510/c1_g1_i1/m.55412